MEHENFKKLKDSTNSQHIAKAMQEVYEEHLPRQLKEPEPIQVAAVPAKKKKDLDEVVYGPNHSKNDSKENEEDRTQIKNALVNLQLDDFLTKKEARVCHDTNIVEFVTDPKQRAREMLNQLLLQNPKAIELVTRDCEQDTDDHHLDVLCDIYKASTDEVREMLADSLNSANKAIPFILPFASKPQLVAWQLFGIKKEWRLGEKPTDIRNERVYNHKCPLVSFIKLG